MKNYAVFEKGIFRGKIEWRFYFYCLFRQFNLIKYLPELFVTYFAFVFRIISPKKYVFKSFYYLHGCDDLEERAAKYSEKLSKKVSILPKLNIISAYPSILLSAVAERYGVELKANEYNLEKRYFNEFLSCEELIGDEEYIAYGRYSSPIMKKATERRYIYQNRVFKNKIGYFSFVFSKHLFNTLILTVYSFLLGIASLYFATVNFSNPDTMFESYFKNFGLLLLNVAPILALCFIVYLLFNSSGVAVLVSTVAVSVLTCINYFKILVRDDPLIADDINNASEALSLTGNYSLTFSAKMIALGVALMCASLMILIFVHHKVGNGLVRFSLIIVLIITSVVLYNTVYTDQEIYLNSADESIIDEWSSTEKYQLRGFIYPLIYSSKPHDELPSESYNEEEVSQSLYLYDYQGIPADKEVNVISVMLEAYSDFQKFAGLDFAINPYEYYNELKEESYSGTLISDIFAGGTIATERAFLTGFNSLHEIKENTNSYPWFFRYEGYKVGGCHPGYEWFYNRADVNERLGFEYYNFNENLFAVDAEEEEHANNDVLFDEIYKELVETNEGGQSLFSFNVSYEGHGPYPSWEKEYQSPFVYNYGLYDDDYIILNNYLNVIYNVNNEIRDFVAKLKAYDEPVVLILFGDHMPLMDQEGTTYKSIGADFDLSTQKGLYDYYGVPYIIWANDAAKETLNNDFVGEGRTIGPYFLMNEFFRLAGYDGDLFSQYLNYVSSVLPVMNVENIYLDSNGNVRYELTESQKALVEEYENVCYFWRNYFCYDAAIKSE